MVGVRNGVGARRTLTYGGEGNVAVVHSFVECQYYICLIAPINYQRRTNQEEGELRSHDYDTVREMSSRWKSHILMQSSRLMNDPIRGYEAAIRTRHLL